MTTLASLFAAPSTPPSGARLVCTDGRALPLKGASLTADAKAGLIRVTLAQTFANPHDEALRVTYSLPLPADAAVSGFSFLIGDLRVVGEVNTRQQARQRFEEALIEGKTAALLDQERSSLFTQEVGNIPPRTEVVCEVTLDQKLAWLPDGQWEWRFPTVVAPRYVGEAGRVPDAAAVSVDVAQTPLASTMGLSLAIRDALADGVRPESPSHALHTERGPQRFDVTFGDERGVGLDRDVVVRWRAAAVTVGVGLDLGRPRSAGTTGESAYGLLTMVPPVPTAAVFPVPRDLIVLLDTSGSMAGQPLDQARRVTAALIDTLNDSDQLELIEFSSAPRRWQAGPVAATSANRRAAQAWLATLRASGGTEMRSGILEALRTLRPEAQRQVVLLTDGLIGGEHDVLQAIAHRLPNGARVHTVGIGSAVNRSLTQPAARAGRGVELIVGLGEDVEVGVKRLLARTTRPLVTEVEVTGSALLGTAPQRLPDVYGGAPALISVRLSPRGGELVLRGKTAFGDFEERLNVPPSERGEGSQALSALFARELVEDLEQQRLCGGDARAIDAHIEAVGLQHQISTRLTSWVAVSASPMVDPRVPRRTEVQPQALPHGMSAEGLGLRPVTTMRAAPVLGRLMQVSQAKLEVAPGSPPLVSRARMQAPSEADPLRREVSDKASSVADAQGGFGEAKKDAPAPIAGKQKAGLATGMLRVLGAAAARRLVGLWRALSGARAALTFVVDGDGLTWAPAPSVRLELADGTQVYALMNVALTTQAGQYADGVTVTLVLDLPEGTPPPVKASLMNDGQPFEVSL